MNCWLLSSPRTGSNYLSVLLNETGLFPNHTGKDRAFDEWLDIWYKMSKEAFLHNPPKHLNIHYAQFNKVFGRNDKSYIDSITPNTRYVVLKRDTISQAVSFYIAKQTHTWRVYNDEQRETFLQRNVPVNMDELVKDYNYISQFRNCWGEFEEAEGTVVVDYEDTRDRPQEVVRRILDSMSLGHPDLDSVVRSANGKYKKMTRDENEPLKLKLRRILCHM